MDTHSVLPAAVKSPLGYLPIAMSMAALLTVLVSLAVGGAAREVDEGASAHIWQLLMAGQVPIILVFALRGLRADARGTLVTMGLQGLAIALAAAPVFALHL